MTEHSERPGPADGGRVIPLRVVRTAALAGLALLLLLWLSSAVFTVPSTETALVVRFGAPQPGVAGPGLHFKAPWPVDEVLRLDARRLVFDNEPVEMLSADKKNVLVDSYLVWEIVDPLRFTQTVSTRAEAEEA